MAEPEASGEQPGLPPLIAIDQVPARVRRPLDLIRLVGLALVVAILGEVGTVAQDTVKSANEDLTRSLRQVPVVIVHSLSLFGAFGALALPLAFIIRDIARGQPRRLVEGVLTGLVAIAVIGGLDTLISANSSSALHDALTHVSKGTTTRPLDAYLAAIFAFVLVLGVAGEPIWREMFLGVIAVYIASAFLASQASLLSLVLSPTIGALVGVAVRYGFGSANERPVAHTIAEELRRRDIAITRIERRSDETGAGQRHRNYLASTASGQHLSVQVFDRDLIASGWAYGIYRRLRIRAAVAAQPALSLERIAERRTLLALAAMAAGVCVPRFVAGVPCGSETIVLVYEHDETTPLKDPTDEQLLDFWANVTRLHHVRMTHRGLTADRLALDRAGRVVLPIPVDGSTFASELRISLDRAQALLVTAELAGPDRAVRLARGMLSDNELAATIPLLQPIALPRQTRAALRNDPELLQSVLDAITEQTHQDAPEATRVERFRPRIVISIVAAVVAGYLIVGQLSSVDVVTVVAAAQWNWVPLVVLASVGTYVAAALSLTGFVTERLSYLRTMLVQVACSFVGFIAPPSVGGVALNIRYLRHARLSATAAATSVAMSQVTNAVVHAVLLVVLVAATGSSAKHNLPVPGWAFAAVGAMAALIMLILALPRPRRWLLARLVPRLREAIPRLIRMLISPAKLIEATTGTLLLNVCYVAALSFSVHAFGGGISIAGVAVVYLAGAAVASVAPTPGGLGAVEIALSTGLAAAGMPSAAAVSAVLLFRLATFWLPVPVGWIALNHLQRVGAL